MCNKVKMEDFGEDGRLRIQGSPADKIPDLHFVLLWGCFYVALVHVEA
jgi:hypothetical protein